MSAAAGIEAGSDEAKARVTERRSALQSGSAWNSNGVKASPTRRDGDIEPP